MSFLLNNDRIIMGVDYYPEHWDKSLWNDDLSRMKDTGIEFVRVAEFAWNMFEPREGEYTWDFFDEFLDLCKEKDIKVIFCTPTATPPAWLTDKYPEVLNAKQDGTLYRHGARRHYNYNSLIYQRYTKNIVERMAEHYAKHPAIIGWQIDNEINCEINEFYSESDTIAFREFLKKKYGSISNLNKAWGTVFWNQTYTSWGEVYVPRTTLSNNTNPHEVLDYKRFVSDSACKWAKLQSDILRKYIKTDDFITTNGLFGDLDNNRMARESLDFITYDSYPNMAYGIDSHFIAESKLKDRHWSMLQDEVRAVNGTYGIMEQQSGAHGWNTAMAAPTPKPGQLTLWTMQSIAHGADFVCYFRWRTCTFGTEIYWHGILDYSGRDTRRKKEITDIHTKFEKLSCIAGSQYKSEVGVIETYSNIFDSELDAWHGKIENTSKMGIYEASQFTHTPIDYIYLHEHTTVEDLAKYKVLFYPHAVIITEKEAALLKEYVNQGGTLVFGCRAGQKDENGICTQEYLPGLVRELTGTDVVEYTLVGKDEKIYVDVDGKKLEATTFNDELAPIGDAKVLGTYNGSYYDGVPGLIENKYGKGKTLYFGGCFNRETATAFLEMLDVVSPYEQILSIPESCEMCVRTKDNKDFIFVLNYSKESQIINVKELMTDLYTGKTVSGEIELKGYETLVLTI
ncbi:MAG: beta-galactosidase [Pseudobutyrivibrio ruminis]|nr:beta-galactosidase [Pseudobutyrivibrio ruminis]